MYSIRFSRRIMSQLQNWAFLTYLHGKPRNNYIYATQECQNVSNTFRHQEVIVSLLNLPCYSYFSCLENFKHSFWRIIIFAVVTLFFWRSDMAYHWNWRGKCPSKNIYCKNIFYWYTLVYLIVVLSIFKILVD